MTEVQTRRNSSAVVSLCLDSAMACTMKQEWSILCDECTAACQWKKLLHTSSSRVRAGEGPAAEKTARKYLLLIWHWESRDTHRSVWLCPSFYTRTILEFTHPDSYLSLLPTWPTDKSVSCLLTYLWTMSLEYRLQNIEYRLYTKLSSNQSMNLAIYLEH